MNFKPGTQNTKLLILTSILLVLIFFDSIKDVHSLKSLFKFNNALTTPDSLLQTDVSYSVQICASYKARLNIDSLKKKLNISDPVKEILHNSWYKYSVGSFADISDARKLKHELRKHKGLGGAFLVCFKNNVRQDNIIVPGNLLPTPNSRFSNIYEYRIQIKASLNVPFPVDTLAKQFSLIDYIAENKEEGWYKYTIGYFDNYKAAKDYRDKLRQKKGLESCFVVAYEKGKRLSHLSSVFHKIVVPVVQPNPPVAQIPSPNDQQKVKDSIYRIAMLTYQKDSLHKDSLNKSSLTNNNFAQLKKKNYKSQDWMASVCNACLFSSIF